MMKKVLTTLVLAGTLTAAVFAQSPETLLGKTVTDPAVSSFTGTNRLDPATGLSYENGVQVFNDGQSVYAIYLFNSTSLNGQSVNAYKGALPFRLTFNETPATLKSKIGQAPTTTGDQLVWDLKDYRLGVSFTDDKKTQVSYISVEKK